MNLLALVMSRNRQTAWVHAIVYLNINMITRRTINKIQLEAHTGLRKSSDAITIFGSVSSILANSSSIISSLLWVSSDSLFSRRWIGSGVGISVGVDIGVAVCVGSGIGEGGASVCADTFVVVVQSSPLMMIRINV